MNDVLSHLNILYIFLCNIVTYLVLGCFSNDLATGWKRLISTVVASVLGALCVFWMDYDKETIFCSFFVQFLMYDYVIKWFLKKVTSENQNIQE